LNIEYLGMITDSSLLFKYVKQSAFFVFPTRKEGMSMQLLEVASLATPVVSSDIEANTDIFSRDEMLFFRSGDAGDLAEKLRFALDNPQVMKENAERAFRALFQNYVWNRIAEQYQTIYQKTLEESNGF